MQYFMARLMLPDPICCELSRSNHLQQIYIKKHSFSGSHRFSLQLLVKKRVEKLKKGSRELKNYCCKVVVVVVAQICIDYFTEIRC